MNIEYQVLIENEKMNAAVVKMFISQGWEGGYDMERGTYHAIVIRPYQRMIGGNDDLKSHHHTITLEKAMKMCFQNYTKHTVRLNDEYQAEYIDGSDYVKVGCQGIPTAKVLELAQLITSK